MSGLVFAAVLFSAFFQASWNFAAKKSAANKIALFAVSWFAFGILCLPVALLTTDFSALSPRGWWLMGASGLIHAFYLCLLGWAYALGEISVVFPIARGIGILCTTIFAVGLGLHGLSGFGLGGILFVIAGSLLVGAREFPERGRRRAFLVAVGVAITVGMYSVVDSEGAKHVPIFAYLVSMDLLAPLLAAPFLFSRLRDEMRAIVVRHKVEAVLVTIPGMIAYAIILWAYRNAPTAYVATLREFSIAIAAALGAIFLRERMNPQKVIGIACILAGVALIKLA